MIVTIRLTAVYTLHGFLPSCWRTGYLYSQLMSETSFGHQSSNIRASVIQPFVDHWTPSCPVTFVCRVGLSKARFNNSVSVPYSSIAQRSYVESGFVRSRSFSRTIFHPASVGSL